MDKECPDCPHHKLKVADSCVEPKELRGKIVNYGGEGHSGYEWCTLHDKLLSRITSGSSRTHRLPDCAFKERLVIWEDKGNVDIWRFHEEPLCDAETIMRKIVDEISKNTPDGASVRLSYHQDKYEESYGWYYQVARPETNEEYDTRLRIEDDRKRQQDKWDLEKYQELRKKFGQK